MTKSPISRRALLRDAACGFGAVGLSALLAGESGLYAAAADPLAPKQPHFEPRAKSVIFLFMSGGPSHIDSFDPKPKLDRDHLKPLPFKMEQQFQPTLDYFGNLMKSPWSFRNYGQSGLPVSDLFPEVAQCVDDLCIVRSMIADGLDHGGALLQMHTGTVNLTRPSLGSWVLYGLGTENQNLPGFITIRPHAAHSGARNWSSAFLPGAYQGTPLGTSRTPVAQLRKEPIENLLNSHSTTSQQRYELDMLAKIDQRHARLREFDERLESRIQTFELAFRMQAEAPDAFDVERESAETKKLYGLDNPRTTDYGWQCLLARRLVERGVRFVQCTSEGWDQHTELARLHAKHASEVDKPIAGLLRDLKSRGMLENTLVIWGGEFGRTPFMERDGRDHNPYGFTMWMAGGGLKKGFAYGATDDYGYHAVENRMHIHDLHATILHLLGLDHTKLTYRYSGRDFRLTDVHGVVAKALFA
ncbi:MAG: DUF1501 domain-containing protein [Bryobacteraceae bacterium]